MKYPLPPASSLGEGAQLDARFKLAVAILLAPGFFRQFDLKAGSAAEAAAGKALHMADVLYEIGAKLEWVQPLTADADPTPEERAHMKRNAHLNVIGQLHSQRMAQEEQNRVVPVQGGRILNG